MSTEDPVALAVRVGELPRQARRVLAFLSERRGPSGETPPIGYGRLSEAVGISEAHLRRVLRLMIRAGLIERVECGFAGSVYRLRCGPEIVAHAR
jgi:DNA-binding IscR family transcriptional regulator